MEVSLKIALPGHHHPIYALEIEPFDFKRFYTAGNDKGIVSWDSENWKFEKVLYPLEHSVYALRRLSGQNILLAGDRGGQLHIIYLADQTRNRIIKGHAEPIFDIAVAPGEDLVFVSSQDGRISVWDTNDWKCVNRIEVSKGPVRTLAVHPDPLQKIVAAGSKEGKIMVFNYGSNQLIQEIAAHDAISTALAFEPEGSLLLSAGRDAKLKVFDWEASLLYREWVPHLFAVYKIVFHPTKPYFATASRDKDIKIWSLPEGKLKKSISIQKDMPAHRLSVNSIAWSRSGDELISVGDDKMVLVWDVDFEGEIHDD